MSYGKISSKQKEILEFMKNEILSKGYPPAVREICEAVNLKSTSSVHSHLETLEKNQVLLKEFNLQPTMRNCVLPALKKEQKSKVSCIALELPTGKIVTGRNTDLLTASASVVLNALKSLANINDEFKLLSPEILKPITTLKNSFLHKQSSILSLKDVLIALSICATTNDMAKKAFEKIPELAGSEGHSTCILNASNQEVFRELKINITSEDKFHSSALYNV